jgi:hypothetical protein
MGDHFGCRLLLAGRDSEEIVRLDWRIWGFGEQMEELL